MFTYLVLYTIKLNLILNRGHASYDLRPEVNVFPIFWRPSQIIQDESSKILAKFLGVGAFGLFMHCNGVY